MNVHILSDSPRGTSAYANICRNMALRLAERGHNVTVTGFQTFFSPENYKGITVLPLFNPVEPNNPQLKQFEKNLKLTKPDALICIHEAHSHFNIYSQMFYPTFFWVPVEGEGIPRHMRDDLNASNISRVVSMSNAGQKELENAGVASTAIYPGWNSSIFKKNPKTYCRWSTEFHMQRQDPIIISDRGCWKCDGVCEEGERCNNKYFEEEKINIYYKGEEFSGSISSINKLRDNLGAEFVVGCVAQNTGVRKRLERLIEAFSLFAKESPDSLLHIHTDPFSSRGLPLLDIVTEYGISDRVVFSYGDYTFGLSDEGMNVLYNYFDINATASSAEGICMPILESESVGIPQLAPNFGTFPELIGENERGLLASVESVPMIENGSYRCLVDVEDMADKMQTMCISKEMRRDMSESAEKWALQYTWDKIVRQWDSLITETEEKIIVAPMGS